jgi:subtilisin family serine protease
MGIIGVAFRSQVMALKASEDGDGLPDSAIIGAIDYCTLMKNRGTNIVAINASFGGPEFSTTLRDSIQAAGDAGIIFCAAAGNSATDNDVDFIYPASYRLANMIVVAASGQSDELASFSSYGPNTVDLAAPGVNTLSALPTSRAGTIAMVRSPNATYAAGDFEYSGTTTGVTATIYYCGLGYPEDFPPAVNNNIALIERGILNFSTKVGNAMAAGARAVIIYNNGLGSIYGTLQFQNDWLPTVWITQADGLTLAAATPTPGTVINAPNPEEIYQFLNGTSMATPHVAGAVAFAAMNFPNETVPQRIARIVRNVTPLPNLSGKVISGGRLNLARTVDTDANGLPDWWEQEYFNHLIGTNPAADADADGASNLKEWLAGTNPTSALSVLRP